MVELNFDKLFDDMREKNKMTNPTNQTKPTNHYPKFNDHWFDVVECCLYYVGDKSDLAGIFSCLDNAVFKNDKAIINAIPEACNWRPGYELDSWDEREEMLIARGYLPQDWRYGREATENKSCVCLYMAILKWKDVLAAEEIAREAWESDLPFMWKFSSIHTDVEQSSYYPVVKNVRGIKGAIELGVLPVLMPPLGCILMEVPGVILYRSESSLFI